MGFFLAQNPTTVKLKRKIQNNKGYALAWLVAKRHPQVLRSVFRANGIDDEPHAVTFLHHHFKNNNIGRQVHAAINRQHNYGGPATDGEKWYDTLAGNNDLAGMGSGSGTGNDPDRSQNFITGLNAAGNIIGSLSNIYTQFRQSRNPNAPVDYSLRPGSEGPAPKNNTLIYAALGIVAFTVVVLLILKK